MNTFKKEIDFHQFNQHNKNSKRTKIVNECLKKASNPKELIYQLISSMDITQTSMSDFLILQ